MQAVVPNNCRVALTWLDQGREARDILRGCPDLRRLYLVTRSREWRETGTLKSVLRDPRVELIELPNGEDVGGRLRRLFERDSLLFIEGRVGVFIPDDQRRLQKQVCDDMESSLLDYTRSTVSRVALRITRGWHMLANGFLNLPRAVREHTLDELTGLAKGRPIVVVGAGPSLDRSVDVLASRRSKAVIIACDGAWSTLEHAGIVPDFVASTDDSERIWRFFAHRKANQSRVPVIGLLQSSWPVFRYHRGPLFLGRGVSPLDTTLDDAIGSVPVFDSGRCVGHAALEAARLLGGSPILLTGFDLAYEGNRFHPRHMPLPYFHQYPPTPENLTTVEGHRGEPLKTDLSMAMYLREFERRIAAIDVPVLNATDGGARIAGARHVDLAAALDDVADTPPLPVPASPPLRADRADERASHFQNRWRALSEDFLRELSSAGAIHERTERAADLPVFLKRHEAMLDLLSVAENPVDHAALKFAWDDWLQGGATVATAGEVRRTARHFLESILPLAKLIPTLLALGDDEGRQRIASHVLSADVPSGDVPAMALMKKLLEESGCTVAEFPADAPDLPAVWNRILAEKAGVVLSCEGSVLPAGWAMPGSICIDVRTTPPNGNAMAEQWLPGYAAVCPTLELAELWRARMPNDRPVFALLPPSGPHGAQLYSAGPLRRDWTVTELVSCLRAEVSTA